MYLAGFMAGFKAGFLPGFSSGFMARFMAGFLSGSINMSLDLYQMVEETEIQNTFLFRVQLILKKSTIGVHACGFGRLNKAVGMAE